MTRKILVYTWIELRTSTWQQIRNTCMYASCHFQVHILIIIFNTYRKFVETLSYTQYMNTIEHVDDCCWYDILKVDYYVARYP